MMSEFTVQNEEELASLAIKFATLLKGGEVVALSGELGAGKTTFVRLLAKALAVKEPISSPTYVLQHEYKAPDGIVIEHWDLYRVAQLPDELLVPSDPKTIRLIEWGERFAVQLSPFSYQIEIFREASEDGSLIESGKRRIRW